MRPNEKVFFKLLLLITIGLALAGCPPKKKKMSLEAPPEELPMTDMPGLEIPQESWVTAPGLEAVYFDTSKAELREDARGRLKKNAGVVKAIMDTHPAVMVRIEGHCDERNTLEYNLALGERRAKAVRDYYASLGVQKTALSTISYGEERPVCNEAGEECWMKNRRGETTLKSSSGTIRVPLDKLPKP